MRSFRKTSLTLFIVPILFGLSFSLLFQRAGFELLSGSEDELQYCSDALHMEQYQHLKGPMDVPVPRPDHWVYDVSTRELAYTDAYRKGAEILLASVFSVTSLSIEQCFPLTVAASIFIFLLCLGYVGLAHLRLSLSQIGLLQFAVAGSFYFLLLHIQGSLANLCSMGLFIASICIVAESFQATDKLKALGLAVAGGVLTAGTLIFYNEIFSVAVLFPGFLVFLMEFVKRPKRRFFLFRLALLIALITLAFSHYAILSVFGGFARNVNEILLKSQGLGLGRALVDSPWWQRLAIFPVLMGLVSYYDNSVFNAHLSQRLADHLPWVGGAFICSNILAFVGFQRMRLLRSPVFLVLVGWFFVLCLSFILNDPFRIARSAGYSVPYVVIGLVLLGVSGGARSKLVSSVLKVPLILVLTFNLFTIWRTGQYVVAHSLTTDKIIRRISPKDLEWRELKASLSPSDSTPVLISGFRSTVEPHWIISQIEPIPNFLGESISTFWHIFSSLNPLHGNLTSHWSDEELRRMLVMPDWPVLNAKYLAESKQAIVPVGLPFPVEWEQWRDIIVTKRIHFENICDVVFRSEKSLTLDPGAVGSLEKDEDGLYRLLLNKSRVIFDAKKNNCFELQAIFDGTKGSVRFTSPHSDSLGEVRMTGKKTQIVAPVNYEDSLNLFIVKQGEAKKLRSLNVVARDCR